MICDASDMFYWTSYWSWFGDGEGFVVIITTNGFVVINYDGYAGID